MGCREAVVLTNGTGAVPFQVALRSSLGDGPEVHENIVGWLYELTAVWEDFAAIDVVDGIEMKNRCAGKSFLAMWTNTGTARRLDSTGSLPLQRWLDLLEHLRPLCTEGLYEVHTAILDGLIDSDDAAAAFERGLAQSSLEERSMATGLRDFDAAAHERAIDRFTSRAATVRELVMTNLAAGVVTEGAFRRRRPPAASVSCSAS